MGALRQQFIEDNKGKRIAVLMPIDQYNKMMEQLEEIDDIKTYDTAKANNDEIIPFDRAVDEIEAERESDIRVTATTMTAWSMKCGSTTGRLARARSPN